MQIEKAMSNQTPVVTQIIEVTPQLLREIADRLENSQKVALPGENVLISFSRRILFRFDPEVASYEIERRGSVAEISERTEKLTMQ